MYTILISGVSWTSDLAASASRCIGNILNPLVLPFQSLKLPVHWVRDCAVLGEILAFAKVAPDVTSLTIMNLPDDQMFFGVFSNLGRGIRARPIRCKPWTYP